MEFVWGWGSGLGFGSQDLGFVPQFLRFRSQDFGLGFCLGFEFMVLGLRFCLAFGFRVSRLTSHILGVWSNFTFGVWDFQCWALGFRVPGRGAQVSGLRPRTLGFGSQVLGLGSWVSGLKFQISGLRFWASGLGLGSRSSLRFQGFES